MSEVPEGVDLSGFARKPPRPTATMTLTRDGPNGPEVLLGLRSETMAAFPGYWAFTGGGVSRVDAAAVDSFSVLDIEHGEFIACILREGFLFTLFTISVCVPFSGGHETMENEAADSAQP